MLHFRLRRYRLALACVGVVLLIGTCGFVRSAFGIHAGEPCAQFIQHKHPSSQLLERTVSWGRRNLDPLTVEAHRETAYGPLQLYHVTCPMGTEQLNLYGFRVGQGTPGDPQRAIVEDIGPERPAHESRLIQFFSSHSGPRPDGQILTYSLGRIIDPTVHTVEATLETGEVVQAERSEYVFVVLAQGQHIVCEHRALDEQGHVLERVQTEQEGCREP